MRTESADPELWFTGRLRAALTPSWPGLFVSNEKPDGRTHVVTVQPAGGSPRPGLQQVRLIVNVYAPTSDETRRLANDVQLELNGLSGVSPVTRCECSGPTVINSKAEPPQRFLRCDALMVRRSRP